MVWISECVTQKWHRKENRTTTYSFWPVYFAFEQHVNAHLTLMILDTANKIKRLNIRKIYGKKRNITKEMTNPLVALMNLSRDKTKWKCDFSLPVLERLEKRTSLFCQFIFLLSERMEIGRVCVGVIRSAHPFMYDSTTGRFLVTRRFSHLPFSTRLRSTHIDFWMSI